MGLWRKEVIPLHRRPEALAEDRICVRVASSNDLPKLAIETIKGFIWPTPLFGQRFDRGSKGFVVFSKDLWVLCCEVGAD